VKLADFGVSYIMENGCDEITTKAGSNFFFSPEACKGSKYRGRGSDIWAAGVTLYYMCMRKYPFISNNFPDLFFKIQNNDPEYPSTLHPLLDDLIKRMLTKDPLKRITIPQIKEHSWITKDGMDPMPELTQKNKIDVTEKDLKSVFTKVRRIARVMLEFKKLQQDNKALASARSNSSMQ